MKEVRLQLPDELVAAIQSLVADGWFASDAEVARLALTEFVHRRQFELQEQYQLEDIDWVLRRRRAKG